MTTHNINQQTQVSGVKPVHFQVYCWLKAPRRWLEFRDFDSAFERKSRMILLGGRLLSQDVERRPATKALETVV